MEFNNSCLHSKQKIDFFFYYLAQFEDVLDLSFVREMKDLKNFELTTSPDQIQLLQTEFSTNCGKSFVSSITFKTDSQTNGPELPREKSHIQLCRRSSKSPESRHSEGF